MSGEAINTEKNTSWIARLLELMNVRKMLRNANFLHALPYIFFLSFIMMLFISNSYYAEKTIREIDRTNNELKEMRSEYISTKSRLMIMSKQSQVAHEVESMQLKESVVPPKKIIIHPQEAKK